MTRKRNVAVDNRKTQREGCDLICELNIGLITPFHYYGYGAAFAHEDMLTNLVPTRANHIIRRSQSRAYRPTTRQLCSSGSR